jgi:hypothetical protein
MRMDWTDVTEQTREFGRFMLELKQTPARAYLLDSNEISYRTLQCDRKA